MGEKGKCMLDWMPNGLSALRCLQNTWVLHVLALARSDGESLTVLFTEHAGAGLAEDTQLCFDSNIQITPFLFGSREMQPNKVCPSSSRWIC